MGDALAWVDRRELTTELAAGGLFLLAGVALLFVPRATAGFDIAVAIALVVLYALVSRVEFPVGAGYVFPSQLVLVPMLLLLPPATVPLLVAAGLVLVRLHDLVRRRGSALRLLFAIPDAWHAVGPGARAPARRRAPARPLQPSAAGRRLARRLPVRCRLGDAARGGRARDRAAAPGPGARACRHGRCLSGADRLPRRASPPATHAAAVLLVLPLAALLMLLARDRHARIEQAQSRLQLAIRERSRLQSAVRRMGDAFAAKLDLDALVDIMLRGSIEALDADSRLPARSAAARHAACPRTRPTTCGRAPRRRAAATAAGAPEQLRTTRRLGARAAVRALARPDGLRGAVAFARRRARSRTTRSRC